MLPNKDGFKILNDLRTEKIDTPIIILTAKSEINDKLNGLENGNVEDKIKAVQRLIKEM